MATITTTSYNSLQTRIARIMGIGDGDYGYGQEYSSAPVSDGDIITQDDFVNLRADILRARQHQIGSTLGSIAIPAVGQVVPTDAAWTKYSTVMSQVETNRTVVPPTVQLERSVLDSSFLTINWNQTSTYTITASFADANAMRNYFNAGSTIEFSANLNSSIVTAKNTSWTNFLIVIRIRF